MHPFPTQRNRRRRRVEAWGGRWRRHRRPQPRSRCRRAQLPLKEVLALQRDRQHVHRRQREHQGFGRLYSCLQVRSLLSARASPKGERAAGTSTQSCQFRSIFSEMAGLIRSGLYTGNDQYVGQNVKFIIENGFFKL